MNDKLKNIIVISSFFLIIIATFIYNLIKSDLDISLSERRKLEQFPELTIKSTLDGSFFEKFENYTMDQFAHRESYRQLKNKMEMKLFHKTNFNNIYIHDNSLVEQIYPLNEKSIHNLTKKMNYVHDNYLTDNNKIYYSIIPDKNYFVNDKNLRLDYDLLQQYMKEDIPWATYIDITKFLNLEKYYLTDSHWRQEHLIDVASHIASSMNTRISSTYDDRIIADFKGVYNGRYPDNKLIDKIHILTNDIIDSAVVYNYETKEEGPVYDYSAIDGIDKYNVYLSGSVSLLKIDNPNNKTERELVVFRDSFGSSLIPLLIEGYSSITIVDTRYISPKILADYIDFNTKDILFLYNTSLINNSSSLK